ncbi:MAG: hypothetical protein IH626_11835 [Rhodospirillales bacterium]|nr:hypothetical protein [Rhodospirillales bacterium]
MGPMIVIHTLAHARAALAAAADVGCPVTLISAQGAAAYLGAAVFREIVAEAARETPGATVTAILDCGDDASLALNALRHGLKVIRLRAGPAAMAAVADIAGQMGAFIDPAPEAPVLDLLDRPDAPAACRAWLLRGAAEPD